MPISSVYLMLMPELSAELLLEERVLPLSRLLGGLEREMRTNFY